MKTEESHGRTLALTGAWLQFCPFIGMLSVFVGVGHLFNQHGSHQAVDINQVASGLMFVNLVFMAGLLLGLIGLIFIAISLIRYQYRAVWFFWFLIIYGVILLVKFPVGTVVGVLFLITSFILRDEFLVKDS